MSYVYGSPKPRRKIDVRDGSVHDWYQRCECCPYGYHIDLDFVRYCENISQGVHRTESFKRRKDRRRQRQSMEVLLGLEPQQLFKLENVSEEVTKTEPLFSSESFRKNAEVIGNALDEVVNDFERTWRRSHKQPSNLPDVTAVHEIIQHAPSVSSISSTSGSMVVLPSTTENGVSSHDFDIFNIESAGLNSAALQNIRHQVAISLERTRELEERVKLIPKLQGELHALKRENLNLLSKLNLEENLSQNVTKCNNNGSHKLGPKTYPHLDSTNQNGVLLVPPPRKDFSVMCSVLTRNIGVGHQYPNTKSVSTSTYDEGLFGDKWLNKKLQFLDRSSGTVLEIPDLVATETQTPKTVNKDCFTQTSKYVGVRSFGISAVPSSSEVGTNVFVSKREIGVSEDSITDILCPKCSCSKSSVAVGPDNAVDGQLPISLAALSSRSRSFNLGEERLNFSQKHRTVACQYESQGAHKSCQCTVKMSSKSCQNTASVTDKGIQYRNEDAGTFAIHAGCNTETPPKIKTHNIGCNTSMLGTNTKEASCNTAKLEVKTQGINCDMKDVVTSPTPSKKESLREKEREKEKEEVKKDEIGALSRIPRLQTDIRKFKRQDTYTKVSEPMRSPRRVLPSKEMQAALKVLNDSLQKGITKNLKNQLKNAVNIVEQEWFRVSSLDIANPLEVESYLDYFEEISYELLLYVVNMADASGNTAMHYSVSHGNFDVVSILLDSKVCDINKPNKAGYTSVMLVSLAELQNPTHIQVVRRLFCLADVNVKAKQHGQTALMLAVSHGRLDMVNMLLEAGADVNIQDEDGSTALMCAAEHGHIEIVKLFLSHPDCDSSISDVDGSTALKIAMEAGHRHIGVLLYAHERNLEAAHNGKLKKSKSASLSPRTQSSPLLQRKLVRAVPETKSNKQL